MQLKMLNVGVYMGSAAPKGCTGSCNKLQVCMQQAYGSYIIKFSKERWPPSRVSLVLRASVGSLIKALMKFIAVENQ